MKTKQLSQCLKENNGFSVCSMSTKISKSSLSRLKIVQNAEDVESIIHSAEAVSCDKEHSHATGPDKFNNDETVGGETLTSLASLSAFSCRMESVPATCETCSDTIFSPILESIDIDGDSFLKYFGGDHNFSVPQLEAEDSDDSSKGSREYYDCSISDFFISDMAFSTIPLLSDPVYDDSTDVRFFPDIEEPITSFKMDEGEIPKSYCCSDMDNGHVYGNRRCEYATVSCDSSLYMSTHHLRSCNQESEPNSHAEADMADCFDPQMFIRNMPELPDLASDMQPRLLPKNSKSVTLVLDLDETLVHSTLDQCDDVDFTFPVFFNTKEHTVYVKQRPHLHTFLKRVAEMFEVMVFTASQSIYAKQLLDILDPDGKIISRRAYRESCIFSDGSYTKDLTALGIDLAKVVIIDNSPQVFRLQVNNGIPIKSWFDDSTDTALLSLLPFLETLVDVDDVRPVIAKRFGNKD